MVLIYRTTNKKLSRIETTEVFLRWTNCGKMSENCVPYKITKNLFPQVFMIR